MAIHTFYPGFSLLTGGTAAALDSVDGNSLVDGDVAIVMASGVFYAYRLNASSGAAESSPSVISPDTNAGTKRWIQQTVSATVSGLTFGNLGVGFSLAGGTTSKTLSVPLSATLPGQDTGTAAPTTGTWPRGWIRWNTAPAAGECIGWVCITAGTSGTWKEWGIINV